jgi:AcrR family transcriptional regulator
MAEIGSGPGHRPRPGAGGALTLFGEHGVSGTTLQMIADSIGVSKASVYYQFKSKEDIVAAAAQPMFDVMARVVTIADAVAIAQPPGDLPERADRTVCAAPPAGPR